jgi:biotin carboxylase
VLLVDPIMTGHAFKAACRARNLHVVSLYTIADHVLLDVSPDHAADDDFTLYAKEPEEAWAQLDGLNLDIRAVVPATEPGVFVADVLAAKLGLTGNDPGSALARRDKAAMRGLAVAGGIRVPAFEVLVSLEDVPEAAERVGYPLILKPATGAAARGVRLVRDTVELRAALDEADDLDLFGEPVRHWLVERYVRGREFAVNTFTVGGRHRVLDCWEYLQPDGADYDQPYWDLVHLDPGDPLGPSVAEFALRALDVFGVRAGPSHVEVKHDGRDVHLIEIGARLPGARMTDHWSAHGAFRPFDTTLAVLLGEEPGMSDTRFDALLGICCIRNEQGAGTLRSIGGLDRLERLPGVDSIHLTYRPGEPVPPTRDLNSVVAKVLVSGTDHAEVLETLQLVRQTITLEIS